MARYLLNAPDEDMERWKADARECGVPFSRWLREAALEKESQSNPDTPPVAEPGPGVASPRVTPPRAPSTDQTKVTPDWKR